MNCEEWEGGDIRRHHRWWFEHLPRARLLRIRLRSKFRAWREKRAARKRSPPS